MVRDKEKYQLATHYRKRGFSYSEIAKICGVSKSTVSNWLAKKAFSKKVKQHNIEKAARENVQRLALLNKARSSERKTRYAEAVKSAETEFKHYKKDPLFMSSLMLYVGAGDNQHPRLIRISNARVEIHQIFLKFAIEYLGVPKDKIRFWLLLYPDLSETACVTHWSKHLKLKKDHFYKNQFIAGGSTKRTLQYGVGNTIIGSTVLKHKLNRWIELALKELQK